jgi:protein required for attachment to host cells
MLLDQGTLVLVMDGARMSLYRNLGKALHANLELLNEKQQHIAETAKLGSDSPGRSFSSVGERRSAYSETDLHNQEEERFIKDCLEKLEKIVAEDKKPAVIIAPPRALGIARTHYSAPLRKAVLTEIDRDYAARPAQDVATLLSVYETQ